MRIVAVLVAITVAMSVCGMAQDAADVRDADELTESPDSVEGAMTLNDIRFDGWTQSDWLDNDYIRALRSYLDDFCAGEIDNPGLEPYKEQVKGKFIIGDIQPALFGGAFIQVIFLDMPDRIFDSWVYSTVDEEKGVVDGYEVRSVKIEEGSTGITKEDLLKGMEQMPALKPW